MRITQGTFSFLPDLTDAEIAAQIDDVIWRKLLHNAVVNPVSALTGGGGT